MDQIVFYFYFPFLFEFFIIDFGCLCHQNLQYNMRIYLWLSILSYLFLLTHVNLTQILTWVPFSMHLANSRFAPIHYDILLKITVQQEIKVMTP